MSTNLAFKEPPNTLLFIGDSDCMVVNYKSEKIRTDKKSKEVKYSATWTLSRYSEGQMLFFGSLATDLEAESDIEAEERIEEISNAVARVMEAAYYSGGDGEEVVGDHDGREIIAAVHARFMSQFLHGQEIEPAVLAVREFLKKMKVKNAKKILSDIFDAKIVEEIKNKELK